MTNKLLLFDIDGVLIKNSILPIDHTFNKRWQYAIEKVFKVQCMDKRLEHAGTTDANILVSYGRLAGIPEAEINGHIEELFAALAEYAAMKMPETAIELENGVPEILSRLKENGHMLGLVTGNIPEVAKMKLDRVGINGYFEMGGFGDTQGHRSNLILRAIELAGQKAGSRIGKEDVFYLGDTPLDIIAGREAGVKTIGVATGGFSIGDLELDKPYAVVKDLTDTGQILGLIDHA